MEETDEFLLSRFKYDVTGKHADSHFLYNLQQVDLGQQFLFCILEKEVFSLVFGPQAETELLVESFHIPEPKIRVGKDVTIGYSIIELLCFGFAEDLHGTCVVICTIIFFLFILRVELLDHRVMQAVLLELCEYVIGESEGQSEVGTKS